MIDCGGLVDWTTPRSFNLYIFDSHHPINHNNIHCGQGVNVIDDGTLPSVDMVPLDEDLQVDEAEEAHDPNEEYQLEDLGDEPKEADERKEEGEQKRKRESDDIYDTSR